MNLTQYYYLVASLPLLAFENNPPFDSQTFLDLCQQQISAVDFDILGKVNIFLPEWSTKDHDIWQKYASWETALRNELVLQRVQRLNVGPDPFIKPAPYFSTIVGIVKDALSTANPKATEISLDRQRWLFLDDLQNGTLFSLGFLIIYRLKLMILERKSSRNFELGKDSFNRHYSEILGEASRLTQELDRSIETEKVHD